MPPTQAESVIKNIIREIGQECAAHGEIVSETLVAFMLCVTRLLDSKNPSLDTIKMQVYFDMNYTSREERVNLADFRKLEWLFPETTANFDKLLIQYRGFCAYTFATTDGLLLPAILCVTVSNRKDDLSFSSSSLLISPFCFQRETGNLGRFKASLRENVLGSPKELMKLSVPSLVYAVQNNMAFLALSNLDAAVYQVTYQLKIPCTALCTVLMLNRTLSRLQWISVFMLCGGVVLVQWRPAQATGVVVEQNPLLGFGAIAVAVLCSGFAGVYFEKVLKSSDTSLWVRNIQMYLSGIVVTLVGVYLSDGAEIKEKGFFYGYTYYVWLVIFLASVGGLYTSVVVKYTDNIMKGFSAAAAIVLSTIASVMLFGLQITLTFALGTLLVCVSIYLYGLPRQDTTSIQQGEPTSKERVGGV
ncbi:hypothetical protein E2I00_012413 [Balaenoptera physalus]|uniref:Uncharacterized protein n=1 Tax=Balaenoptera physalus TaxID=9770 RepID=A0A643BX46_BALPH|nr:hypothetical protein E2I00_012413 [Balaenoptera physalus]